MKYTTISEDSWFGAHGWTHTRLIYWEGHELRFNFYCGIQGYSTPSAVVTRGIDGALCVELGPGDLNIEPQDQHDGPGHNYFEADMAKLCQALEKKFGVSEEAKLNRPLNLFDCVKDPEASAGVPAGVTLIARERQRHFEKGYDAACDDRREDGSLAQAAVCYATYFPLYVRDGDAFNFVDPWPDNWPASKDKRRQRADPYEDSIPNPRSVAVEDRINLLVESGALIAAEIDRLTRMHEAEMARQKEAEQRLIEDNDIPF